MADDLAKLPEQAPGVPPPVAPVASSDNRTAGESLDSADSAESLAIEHEGLRGGKSRLDGLVPGSKEAKSASKLYESIRKWQDRNPGQIHPQEKSLHPSIAARFIARRKPVPPPRTPIAAAISAAPVETVPPVLPSAASRPEISLAGHQTDDPAALLAPATAALELWIGTDVEQPLKDFIAVIEEWRDYSREKKLLLAKLPPDVVAEIKRDSQWNEGTKKIICERGGRVIAKLLNRAGISAQYKDEVILSLALVTLLGSEIRMQRRINKLIAGNVPA
ncbi:MAG TPA: hypothetical protein VN516_09495 [Candidatus Baltobacteraceae bacterium]|nr:hypothetical protein [Candidatus Baltobacteraceae bacterium]